MSALLRFNTDIDEEADFLKNICAVNTFDLMGNINMASGKMVSSSAAMPASSFLMALPIMV